MRRKGKGVGKTATRWERLLCPRLHIYTRYCSWERFLVLPQSHLAYEHDAVTPFQCRGPVNLSANL